MVLALASAVRGVAGADHAEKLPARKISPEEARAETLAALEEFNDLVGGWRGVGQPVRNSNKGSWIEAAEWVWELKKDRVGLRYVVKGGKLLEGGILGFDPATRTYRFEASLADNSLRVYSGQLKNHKLSLESPADDQGRVHQIVITRLNDKRTVVLLQSRLETQGQFARVAEVGYTREGTRLAEDGGDGPQCIVTGGKGTSSVVYKGQTYWFCCSGCRDAFNDDPEAIIAEAAERAKKKAAKGANKP